MLVVYLCIQSAKSFAYAVAAGIVRFQQTAFVANFIYTMLLLGGGAGAAEPAHALVAQRRHC